VLEEMRIADLGVISDAVLTFGPGLSVVTGETGAGKTMVVTGLTMLLGGRADTGAVRSGSDAARVEGRFVVDGAGSVAQRALDAGAGLDPVGPAGPDLVELLVARTVASTGRGRAHLGGRSVPVAVLAELAEDLVAVHGQSEQVLLRSPARQRDLVDRFGGTVVAQAVAAYRVAWTEYVTVDAELSEITSRARERGQEAEVLRAGLAEVEAVDPQPGEDVDLKAVTGRLEHAEELLAATGAAHQALTGQEDVPQHEPDVLGLVEAARRSMEAAAQHDEDLTTAVQKLAEIGYLAADVAAEIASYQQGVDADPARLAAVHERRAALAVLTRRHGPDVDAVLEWAAGASVRLLELDGDDGRVEVLAERHRALDLELERVSEELRSARRLAGERLAAAVAAELAALAMPAAEVHVHVVERPRGPHGADEVTLLLRPHHGAEPRPLSKGASGGELSRVMLAVEVALAGTDPVPTFVFDEVDAGVGGKAAVEIGRRLARLAQGAQVIVVTHLPQVAAFADRHLVVSKADDGHVTESGVRRVEGEERLRELARMLAGQEHSASAREHAAELLDQARTV